jgi:DNA-binding LytR/AlgR family response regulator
VDTLNNENASVTNIIKAAYTRRDLPIRQLSAYAEIDPVLEQPIEQIARYNVYMASFSTLEDRHIDLAKSLRRRNDKLFIVFIINKQVDVASCVRPSVRPSGILFVPLEKIRLYQTINEIYSEFTRISQKEKQPVFRIRSSGEYITVNTGDISFFESQGKRIAIKTRGQEILFYSNFESVLERLPDCFVRCHKGFVVNTRQIVNVNFPEMTIKLEDQSIIPISRTYRDDIKSFIVSEGV